MSTAVVLGGGISGLSCAFYLARAGAGGRGSPFKKIILCEGSSKFGGWVQSVRNADGAVYELGPNSIRVDGKLRSFNTLNLVEDLGLQDKVLPVPKSHSAAGKRYVQAGGKLYPMTFRGINSMFNGVLNSNLLQVLKKEVSVSPLTGLEDESMHDFASRRFNRDFADYLFDPLCLGVYAGDARRLSVKSAFPDVWQMEGQYGSLVRGMAKSMFSWSKKGALLEENLEAVLFDQFFSASPARTSVFDALKTRPESLVVQSAVQSRWAMWSMLGGLHTLVDGLVAALDHNPSVQIIRNVPCDTISSSPDSNKLAVGLADGSTLHADHVFSAVPAWRLSPLLASEHRVMKDLLNLVPKVSVALVHLEYEGKLPGVPPGFGYLVPSNEASKLLGVIFASQIFPELSAEGRRGGGNTRILCMLGGAWFHEQFGDPDSVSPDTLREAALSCFTFPQKPVRSLVQVNKDCIPQYHLGHHRLVNGLDNYIEDKQLPLSLIGASYRGVSVNDCIYQAKLAVLDSIRDALKATAGNTPHPKQRQAA